VTDDELRQILSEARTIASVGLSGNPSKESYGVAAYLKEHGYRIVPVNPSADQILGSKAFPDLLSVPEPVDVVQLFRPSDEVLPFVRQAIQIGAKVIWMQSGISNEDAAAQAESAGARVVMDHCMRAEHRRLIRPNPSS
jgi:predicted CoA-binding protein